jgi:hypothetical protein
MADWAVYSSPIGSFQRVSDSKATALFRYDDEADGLITLGYLVQGMQRKLL